MQVIYCSLIHFSKGAAQNWLKQRPTFSWLCLKPRWMLFFSTFLPYVPAFQGGVLRSVMKKVYLYRGSESLKVDFYLSCPRQNRLQKHRIGKAFKKV